LRRLRAGPDARTYARIGDLAKVIKRLIHNIERNLAARDNNRIVRDFEWGTEFLHAANLAALDAERVKKLSARDFLFQFNQEAINDSESFFKIPASPQYEINGNRLTFRSAVTTPYVHNNRVHATYFPVPATNDAGSNSTKDEVARARRRAVVVLPHWNAKPHEHVQVCKLLNRIGIASLRMSLPYHDHRMLPGFERADFMVSANLGRTLQANRQAVLDTRAAVNWLDLQGYERIGILGTSLGSCIAFLAFVHEPKINVGVYNHVSSYFGDVVWDGLTTAHVRRGLETTVTKEEVRRAWLAISPNSYISKLRGNPRRGLLVSASYDLSFTPSLSRLLFDECERHDVRLDRRIVPCGHYTLGRPPYKYYAGYLILKYFRTHL
jgi:hypothetical protein